MDSLVTFYVDAFCIGLFGGGPVQSQ